MTTSRSRKVAGSVEFNIPLAPVPAARVKHSKWGAYYPPRYETFRKDCRRWLEENLEVKDALTHAELEVISTFVCKRPKKPAHGYPRGDIDNFEKALYDAITSSERVWNDDVQISMVRATKRYAIGAEDPCIQVKVRPLHYE